MNNPVDPELSEIRCHEPGIDTPIRVLDHHIQSISTRITEGNTQREYQCLGSGLDKGFYYREGDRFGYIDTSSEVKKRELKAEEKLRLFSALRNMIPEIDRTSPRPRDTQLKNGNCSRKLRGDGYWVERIETLGQTFKPKAMVFQGELRQNYKKMFRDLKTNDGKPDIVRLKRTAQSLISLIHTLKPISNIVGELTLALSNDGSLKMLDCAPDESGGTGGDELYTYARQGLESSINFINSMLPREDQVHILEGERR